MKKNYVFLIIMCLWNPLLFCQEVNNTLASFSLVKSQPFSFHDNSTLEIDDEEVVFPFDGTYQFVFLHGRKSVFTDDILNTIARNRKQSERTILQLTPHCKVIILSEEEIRSSGFVPLQRQYVFE